MNTAFLPQRFQNSNEHVTWILCWKISIFISKEYGLEDDLQNNIYKFHVFPEKKNQKQNWSNAQLNSHKVTS